METRSNKILVSLVVALVLAAIIAFALWLTANRRSNGREYDILLTQSVSGLLVGSPVTFSGVPVGRVKSIELDRARPGRIRVRIDITKDDLPMHEGTVAHLSGDLLFGTSLISLERKERSGRVLAPRAGEQVPVIPLEGSGLGDLVSDPTPMVESISYATDRLLAATTPEEQRRLQARLDEMVRATGEMAAQAPQLGARIAPAREALRTSASTSIAMGKQARDMRRNLEARTTAATRDLRASLAAARESTRAFDEKMKASRASVKAANEGLAGASQKIRQAREGVAAVTESVKQVEAGGVGSLVSGPPTPDYDPKAKR